MYKKTQRLVLILASLQIINAYKYLVVSPIPGKSHAILGDAMVELLVEAGHEVTYITSVLPEKIPQGVTIVDTSDHQKLFPIDASFVRSVMDGKLSGINIGGFVTMMMQTSRATLENLNVQKLLADKNQTFDAVIAEWMYNEVYAGFAGVYNCPLIWFSTLEPQWMLLQTIDEIPNPAYSTDMFSKTIPPFTFLQRVRELIIKIEGKLLQTLSLAGLEQEIYEKYLVPVIRDRRRSVPPWDSLKYNASLIIHNSHVSMGSPARLPLNVVSVGGFYIKPDLPPLPEDLQKLMDSAKHGVIYFSLGSTVKSKSLPDHVRKSLLSTLGKYNQTVLWKFEENLPGTPKNVRIVQWAPQQSILAHKNCRLFITHGGLLSTTEALHYGVPMIGIPIFGDQYVNVERVVQKGFGLKVDLSYSLGEDLDPAIGKIVDDPKYATRVKELSAIYHDRPLPPGRELIHWVEHVVRTNGAPHLRSPAIVVPWYQKLYLDLVLVVLVIILLLKYVLQHIKGILSMKIKVKQL